MNSSIRLRIRSRLAQRLIFLALLTGALALLVAACGSSSSTSTTPATAGATSTTAAAVASPSTTTATPAATPTESGSEYASPAASPAGSPSTGSVELAATNNPSFGSILTDGTGRTLYVFKKDSMDTSTCYNACQTNWPPLVATTAPSLPSGASGTISLITRKDGTHQVAYNGEPLYYFSKDSAPGDTKGNGIGNLWSVVKLGS